MPESNEPFGRFPRAGEIVRVNAVRLALRIDPHARNRVPRDEGRQAGGHVGIVVDQQTVGSPLVQYLRQIGGVGQLRVRERGHEQVEAVFGERGLDARAQSVRQHATVTQRAQQQRDTAGPPAARMARAEPLAR
jgi:hypothetical protein